MKIIENLYNILHINDTATDGEIKKAYVKLIRKYSPEKWPEEFKKIRQAYEKLIDPIYRSQYDAFFKYKDEIDEHCKLGDKALEKEDYKTAIKEYKKILIIEPNITFARNNLGLALLYNEQYDEAIIEFKKLMKIDSKDINIYMNISDAYKKNLDYDNAESYLLEANKLDPINQNVVARLLLLYKEKNEYDKSIDFLRECLKKNKNDINQEVIYYLEIIKLYIYYNRMDNLQNLIDEIKEQVIDNEERKDYLVWNLGKIAYELFQNKMYEFTEKICKIIFQIDNSNENIKILYEENNKMKNTFILYNKLLDDERIIAPLKGPIMYYLFGDTYNEDELNENYNKNLKAIQSYIKADFDNVMKCIHILKNEYYILYNYEEEIYKEIYISALKSKELNDKYNELRKDSLINDSIIRLVSLILCENLSSEDTKDYFKDIINELNYESYNSIINSIDRLRNHYSILYNLNSKIFDDLIILASENNIKSNITQNNTCNSYRSDYRSDYRSNYRSNNEQLGCIVMIICAIIGGAIGNIPGFIIGAIIGAKFIDEHN